ncbi:MAG: Neopullulanase 2 [Chroococcopsis gigantea SAG 12.99]|jgi:cyclomaltodextrinase|nr:glycoside hydrolase family 13 protein [Chlorogloea purpurea SAG 13.99]MDV3000313.1 Neopullulanase 2 [Chroococcopsis gigantea SAG 12.99]
MDIKTPDWVKNAIFYQIFPDRFARAHTPKGMLLSSDLQPWHSTPTLFGYKGGDLWGVIDKLDYLQDLGINAIYFTPIFQSASNHRYHTHDYYQIDPMLGGNEAFDALIEAAHHRNIKIILDGVFNHASRGFFFFNDILENGKNSAWLDWFKIEDWPLYPYDESQPANYVSWIDIRSLPQFNHDHPQVREYLMQVGEYWIKKGIDGWRLDVPFEIKTPGFWHEFRSRIKNINPDAYIVGEVWHDARQWLDGLQFDGVMNYLFTEATMAFVGGDRVKMEYVDKSSYKPYPALSARNYGERIEEILTLYPWEIQLTQYNLLDSHDTARLITIVGEDKKTVELATLLMFTFPGTPSIYYGDEVGLEGGIDPDCRRCFPEEEDWDWEVLDYHKSLIYLRHNYPALRTGAYHVLYSDDHVYVFARILENQEIIVAINISDALEKVSFSVNNLGSTPNHFIYGKGHISWREGRIELSLEGRSGCIIG